MANWKKIGKLVVIGGLTAIFLLLTISSVREESATSDETWHVSAGLCLLRTGDFRMNTDNPFPPNALAALPLALDKNFLTPSVKDDTYRKAQINFYSEKVAQLNGGYKEGEKYELTAAQLFKPRMIMATLVALLLLTYALLLSKNFNARVGIVALILLGFSPSFLAHAPLTTTDALVAMMIFFASYALWRFHRTKTRLGNVLLFLTFLITAFAALMTKHTAILVVPLWLLLLIYSVYKKFPARPRTLRVIAATLLVILSLGAWVYGIHYSYGGLYKTLRKTRYKDFIPIMEDKRVLLAQKNGQKLVELYDKRKVLFPYYLQGVLFNMIFKNVRGHESYFMGKYENVGPAYYLAAFSFKETVPFVVGTFVFLCWLMYLFYHRRYGDEILFLGVPPFALALIFSFSHVKIGIRHILPVYPFLALGVAIMAEHFLSRAGWRKRGVVYLSLASIFVSAIYVYPHYLSYFNFVVGGSRNGYKWLQDSNFDWGQNELRARQIAEKSEGKIEYLGSELPTQGKQYLVRLSEVYGVPRNRTSRSNEFKKLLDEKKLRIVDYSLPTHWLVYFPDPAAENK